MKHTCEQIYDIGANKKQYGKVQGICRITGKKSEGVLFEEWVRNTFNDHDSLFPGTIISNQALFCFDESSEIIQNKTGRDKPQRFRTYSHIVQNGNWHCVTKADKQLIFQLIISGANIVCLTDTGQKHVLFKHKEGLWQLDDLHIVPNLDLFKLLHTQMCELLALQFSQTEIITGNYSSGRIIKAGLKSWTEKEQVIKAYRGSGFFDFAAFMLYTENEKQAMPEPVLISDK